MGQAQSRQAAYRPLVLGSMDTHPLFTGLGPCGWLQCQACAAWFQLASKRLELGDSSIADDASAKLCQTLTVSTSVERRLPEPKLLTAPTPPTLVHTKLLSVSFFFKL